MSLYEKIFNVMNESAGLEKNLQVGTGNSSYKAIGEAEVLNMLKPLFKKHKLIIFPIDGEINETNSIWESTSYDKKETKTRNVTLLKVKYKIVDIESKESEIIIGFGNGADSQDKGSGKAFTYSFKTALSKTFMLFSGEDTDNDHSDDIGKPKNSEQPKQTPPHQEPSKTDSQPSDLEKRATAIYFQCTGNKEGQLGWTKEAYKAQLKAWKDAGNITTDYGKKWTEQDITWLESELEDGLPF